MYSYIVFLCVLLINITAGSWTTDVVTDTTYTYNTLVNNIPTRCGFVHANTNHPGVYNAFIVNKPTLLKTFTTLTTAQSYVVQQCDSPSK